MIHSHLYFLTNDIKLSSLIAFKYAADEYFVQCKIPVIYKHRIHSTQSSILRSGAPLWLTFSVSAVERVKECNWLHGEHNSKHKNHSMYCNEILHRSLGAKTQIFTKINFDLRGQLWLHIVHLIAQLFQKMTFDLLNSGVKMKSLKGSKS